MSHVKCPKCGSTEHTSGYGFAVGGLGMYTICECGKVLEWYADTEGLTPEEAAEAEKHNIIAAETT